MVESSVHRRLAAIMVADVAGYSRLMGTNEEGTLAALRVHQTELVDGLIAAHNGRIVKTTGDGFLAEFASVVDAAKCAIAIQEGMRERNAAVPTETRIAFRIGINVGDVIVQDGDLFGDGVNVAARLEGLAKPGGVCVSDMVRQSIKSKLEVGFDDLGPQRVKNIGEPVHAYWLAIGDVAGEPGDASTAAPPLPERPSIAVLPFDNLSGDPEQEYFSDGITEDIITELSKISGLFVIARHSAFTYKGRSVTLRQVGQELGVRYVLEGSVRKSGSRLRITVQLIDATTDHHLWAERYDRELEDIFAVQDDVARSVASALAIALKPGEDDRLSRAPTQNVEAYDIYLRSRTAPWPPTRGNILTARSAYRRIVDIDPGFAGGYAGMSVTHAFAIMFGFSEDRREDTRLAMALAQDAVDRDDQFTPGYSALGLAHAIAGRYDDGIRLARRAVELQPGDADAHTYLSFTQLFAGVPDDAYVSINTAIRLDPQYFEGPYLNILGIVCFFAGRYDEAVDAFQRNIERGGPIAAPAVAFRAAAQSAAGNRDEAEKSARALLEFAPSFSVSRFAMLAVFRPVDRERASDALRGAGLSE